MRQYTGSTIGPDGEDQALAQMSTETTQLFYFAGRPVAQLTSGPELLYLTTDHLGTPVLATDTSGAAVWAGGVEPFGRTWTAGSDNPDPEFSSASGIATAPTLSQLSSEKVFLRYPGQWASDLFRVTGTQEEIYYNVYRWSGTGVGRFTQPDPLGLRGSRHLYSYAEGTPTVLRDPLGLAVEVYCHLVGAGDGLGLHDVGGAMGYKHCFVRAKCDCAQPFDLRLELTGNEGGQGIIPLNPPTFQRFGPIERVGYIPGDSDSQDCSKENCLLSEYHRLATEGYPYGNWLSGPNSNTFASGLLSACGVQEVLWPTGVPPYTEP